MDFKDFRSIEDINKNKKYFLDSYSHFYGEFKEHEKIHLQEINDEKKREKTKKTLQDILFAIAPLFAEKPFFMSEEFSLVDCCFAPLLWRLPLYGIELPAKQAKAIYDYQKRIFERDSFQASLSEAEMELRE